MRSFIISLILGLFAACALPQTHADDELRAREEAKLHDEELELIQGIKSEKSRNLAMKLLTDGGGELMNFHEAPIGSVGRIGHYTGVGGTGGERVTSYQVDQVIDQRNMIIAGASAWVEGVDASDVVDESQFDFSPYTFEIKGTKRYETAVGTRTVRHLVAINTATLGPALTQIAELRQFRVWLDANEKHAIVARFEGFAGGKAELVKRDGKSLALPVTKLSKLDQQWIRDEVKRQKAEKSASPRKK